MRQLLFLSILIFYSFSFFNPTNQWREILTKHHRFIYPSEYEPIAQQIAWLNEQTYSYYCKHLEIHRKTKWNIVLNNKSFNNAFVTFGAPQYSQFFGGLSSGIFQSIHWNYILTVHEGRHQAQLDKLNYGLIHLAKEIGGERLFQYLAGGSSVAWYMEGEAVNFETRFSQRGRGNIPGFDRNLKAILLERASKNEENIYYKDIEYRKNIYFPNHYVYGYVLASYMIKKYGNEIWDRVLSVNAFVPIPSLGFNFSVLLQAGLPIDFHYKKAMRELTEIYQKQLKSLPITSVNKINPRKKIKKAKNWLNYEFQGEFSNGDLLVKKTSLDRHSELITLNNKKEKVVFKGSFRLSRTDKVNVTGNKAVWSYANIDPLWTSELYADIVLYDHNTKKIKTSDKKKSLFRSFY